MPSNIRPYTPVLGERTKASMPDWLRKIYEDGKNPDLNAASAQVRRIAREFNVLDSQIKDEDKRHLLNVLFVNLLSGKSEQIFPSKAKAARVRELVREFNALKEQFSDADEQFYLDSLLANLICGEPEPSLPVKPGTSAQR